MVERIRILLDSRQLTPTQFADAIGVARPIVSHILSGRNKPSLEVVQRILAAMPDLAMPWLLNGTGPMLTPAPTAPQASVLPATVSAPAPAATPAPPVDAVAAAVPISTPRKAASEVSPPAPALHRWTTARVGTPVGINSSAGSIASNGPHVIPKRFTANDLKASLPVPAPAPAPALPSGPEQAPAVEVALPNYLAQIAPAVEPPVPAGAPDIVAQPAPAPADELQSAFLAFGSEKPIRRIVIFYRDGSFADFQPE